MITRLFGKRTPAAMAGGPVSGGPPPGPGKPVETPFGEDIANPDARAIPPQFHGTWTRDAGDRSGSDPGVREIVEGHRVIIGGNVEHVVAVRFISSLEIAVVTRSGDGKDGQYSLHNAVCRKTARG